MAKGPEQAGRPDKKLNRNWVALGLAGAAAVVAAGLYLERDFNGISSTPGISTEDLKKQKEDFDKACEALKEHDDMLSKIPLTTHRREALQIFSTLGSCTDPKSTNFNFEKVCSVLSEGIRSNSAVFSPFWHFFYLHWYNELECVSHEFVGDRKLAVDKLMRALESTEEIKKYRLLDPSAPIDQICNQALDFVATEKGDLAIVNKYILAKSAGLKEGSALKQMIDTARAKQESQGKPSSNEALEQNLESTLGWVAAAAWFPSICKLPVKSILEKLSSVMPGLTEEDISKKRTLFLPVLRELLVLLKDDESAEGQEATESMLRIGRSIAAKSEKVPGAK